MKFQTQRTRQVLGAIGLTVMTMAGAWAQGAYPAHAVRIIVPWPAGGSVDMATRVVAEQLSGSLGQPVVVENRPGAAGNIGAAAAAKAAPDGYTLLVATTPMIINRSLPGSAAVADLSRDFAPVGQLVSLNYVMVTNPAMAASVQELVAKAKASPGRYSYASSGPGTQLHLIGESFKHATGVDIVHAPYKGAPPALADLVGGHVQLMFPGLPVVEPLLRSGQLRALAVVSTHRLPQLPEVPTLAEAGVAGIDSSEWYGLVAPAGTPPQVVARLSGALAGAMQSPAVRQRLTSQGFEPVGGTPQAFASLIEAEQKKWPLAVRRAGLQPE